MLFAGFSLYSQPSHIRWGKVCFRVEKQCFFSILASPEGWHKLKLWVDLRRSWVRFWLPNPSRVVVENEACLGCLPFFLRWMAVERKGVTDETLRILETYSRIRNKGTAAGCFGRIANHKLNVVGLVFAVGSGGHSASLNVLFPGCQASDQFEFYSCGKDRPLT